MSLRLVWNLFLALAMASSIAGCAAIRELLRDPKDAVVPLSMPDPLYEELATHYVELCAVSQYRPLDGNLGGIPGHAVMYLKGACADETAPYPRLRKCRYASSDPADPEHGAGVSVNRWFKNVNWVATPGRFLFYDGDVRTYETLDQERFDAAVQRAIDLEMFRGVEFHPVRGADGTPELREFIASESLGTDFGLRFGRTVFCARLPMHPEMLARAMDYLNDLNEEYWSGQADYEWSGYSDNCVHTLHNALAAAGVWEPKSVRETKIRQFFNVAVPANTVVDLAFLSNEYPIEDYSEIRGDALHWKGLTENDWLPAVPGALIKILPVLQVNKLYDTKFRMFTLGGWFSNDTLKRSQQLLRDGRYLQLDANLRYFYERYEKILADRDADPRWTDAVRGAAFLRAVEGSRAGMRQRREAGRNAAILRRILIIGLSGVLGASLACTREPRWRMVDQPTRDDARMALKASDPTQLSRDPSTQSIPPVPIRRRLRPCCAFGADLASKMGPIPVPAFRVGNMLGRDDVGPHTYDSGLLHFRRSEQQTVALNNEKNGLIYTCRGGFIDTAHVRDYADWASPRRSRPFRRKTSIRI
jgi:hypothetical protein